ncbi:thioredoxin domain-containing protein [Rapidithrix thailandica]|uniref:Thioredoxin domain-containing protein n=1 Tax=Rapidithrix thailandica TaxID=413964 RepID=A0AAW9S6J2_9BACT
MIKRLLCLLGNCVVLLMLLNSCKAQNKETMQEEPTYTNQLVHSSSPYLLQHAHNPVDWYPWGKEALEKAEKEDKLLIISIGYAACHWCHVMEKESFEDTTVAKVMNAHFVSVKVDREERPDIDAVYMDVAHLLTGSGGWPLNVIALPDGRAVFAGTYFRKEQWMSLLEQLAKIYKETPEKVVNEAEKIAEGVQRLELVEVSTGEASFAKTDLDSAGLSILKNIDFKKGGPQRAPKFPMPNVYQFLMQYHHLSGNREALEAVTLTLDKMAKGGIYDQLGGGFARYSVDDRWLVPHFEKMLYDNAQLVSLYTNAYQLTGKELYKEVVYETLAFVERELSSEEGGFYSSLDADSEGEEGKFYVWNKHELDSLLGAKDAAVFCEYYAVEEKGNWEEGKNILNITEPVETIAERHQLSVEALASLIEACKQKLLAEREKRIRPGLDDKVLASWNALMLKGYLDAYRVFGEKKFLEKARKSAAFIEKNFIREQSRMDRNYKNGKSSINAFLDDYSFTIEAFIAFYQVTFEEEWLHKAERLMGYVEEHFYDENTKMYFYTSSLDDPLMKRSKEVSDNVIPASNSSIAKSMFFLGTYLYKNEYVDKATAMLNNMLTEVKRQGEFFSNWAVLLGYYTYPPYEVAIVGEGFEQFRQEMEKYYLPNVFLLGGINEGKMELLSGKLVEGETFIYVCKDKACKLPVKTTEKALKQIVY